MFSFLSGAAIKLLLGRMWGNAKSDFARIPPKWKLALLAIALLVAAFFVHQHYAHKALKTADQAGYDRARAEDAAALKQLRDRARTVTANGASISQQTRTSNEQENLSIHAAAHDVRLRGPGASGCRRVSDPAISAASGGPVTPDRSADAALAQVSAGEGADLFGLPVDGAVSFAEDHDLDRTENLSWRDWYQRQSAEWTKLRTDSGVQPAHR